MCFIAMPAMAEWAPKVEKDPFNGKTKADMIGLASGWAAVIVVGCGTHGYLSITALLATEMPRGVQSFNRPVGMQVRVDDNEIKSLSAEAYGTTGNKLAVRTTAREVSTVMALLKEIEDSEEQIALKVDFLESHTAASARGTTRSAQLVRRHCG